MVCRKGSQSQKIDLRSLKNRTECNCILYSEKVAQSISAVVSSQCIVGQRQKHSKGRHVTRERGFIPNQKGAIPPGIGGFIFSAQNSERHVTSDLNQKKWKELLIIRTREKRSVKMKRWQITLSVALVVNSASVDLQVYLLY